METQIGCWYAMYVTVKLVTADQSTGNWILGVEFCINLWHAFQIIWIHNKVHGDVTVEEIRKWKNKKEGIIRNLVAMETIEILIPLAYSIGYATAYYGPNARIMIGVKNTYWGNTEQDIKEILTPVFKMAGLDTCGTIIIGVLLGLICQINFLDEVCTILKKYWIILSLMMGAELAVVSTII